MDTTITIIRDVAAIGKEQLISLMKRERGQTLVEYTLILALTTLAIVGVLGILGDDLTNFYDGVVNELGNTV